MIFTLEEVKRLFNIIDYRLARIVLDTLGGSLLTQEDKQILKKFNFDLSKELKKIPPYWQTYLFGRLSSVLTPEQLKTLNYTDVNKYIEKQQYIEPTKREMAEYRVAAVQTYTYLKGLGEKIKTTLQSSVSQEELKVAVEERRIEELSTIKKEIEEGLIQKRSVTKIVSEIGHKLDDWNRDWARIVETECQNIFEIGKAQVIMDEHGINALVYKDVQADACKYCVHLYTTGGIGSEPRLFKISSLINNGSNIGRKAKDWKAVLGVVHPFCRCDLRYLPEGYKWNEDSNQFELPQKFERKIERKSKVKITVGDKVFEV